MGKTKGKSMMLCSIVSVLSAVLFLFSPAEAKLKKISPDADKPAVQKTASKDVTRVLPSGEVEFVYSNPSAKNVFVAGNFNDWNSSRDALSKDKKGLWRLTLPLKPGHHQYKFVVDGAWLADPTNSNTTDDGFGGVNSVIEVKSSPAPSIKSKSTATQPIAGGVKFVYKNTAARSVSVAGSFNSWNTQSDPMVKEGDTWVLIKKLPKGSYQYKFVVDGAWIQDVTNPETTDDGFGGKNSVIEVK